MTAFLEELARRRRFGMKPGLETIRALCTALGDPQTAFGAVHVAGTNGKGAVCAILDACLRRTASRPDGTGRMLRVGRYTSPHLIRLNERFHLDGHPVDDGTLDRLAARTDAVLRETTRPELAETTFFEALTAVAFLLYAEAAVDYAVLETGLGGRLDATNVCRPALSVITRIGLDHCAWLGNTLEAIAAEKAGIVKPGIPVVLGANDPIVRRVVEARARAVGAPFHYAPELASETEIPSDFALEGSFNRENCVTALAALRLLLPDARFDRLTEPPTPFAEVVWPGRFQRLGRFLLDGAHNPPAARALAEALGERTGNRRYDLVFGACGDKDVSEVLQVLAPFARRGFAVRTGNPRSLPAAELGDLMRRCGIDAHACDSVAEALARAEEDSEAEVLVCGSLFLVGEALSVLASAGRDATRVDPSERLFAV